MASDFSGFFDPVAPAPQVTDEELDALVEALLGEE